MAKAKKVGYAKYRVNHLKAITARAKQIRKANPSMKWTDAIKNASGKKVSPAKKTVAKKVAKKKIVAKKVAKRKVAGIVVMSGKTSLTQTRNYYESEIRRTGAAIEAYKKNKTPAGRKALKMYRDHLRNLKRSLREQNSIIARSI